MHNVLQDMVQRLRAIELLLRNAERIADQSARRAGTDKAMRGGEQGRWCASTFPTRNA